MLKPKKATAAQKQNVTDKPAGDDLQLLGLNEDQKKNALSHAQLPSASQSSISAEKSTGLEKSN